VAGAPEATAPLDRRRLERILAPFAALPRGSRVSVVDAAGGTLAGPEAVPGRDVLTADVVVDGTLVARVVATPHPRLQPMLDALAVGLAELASEAMARSTAEQALA